MFASRRNRRLSGPHPRSWSRHRRENRARIPCHAQPRVDRGLFSGACETGLSACAERVLPRRQIPGFLGAAWTTTHSVGERPEGSPELRARGEALRRITQKPGKFARSRQGSNACVRRAATDGRPGFARSRTAQRNGFTASRKTNAIHAPIRRKENQLPAQHQAPLDLLLSARPTQSS